MKKSEVLRIIREEVEVVLTNEEMIEFFDLDPAKLLDEMMKEATYQTWGGTGQIEIDDDDDVPGRSWEEYAADDAAQRARWANEDAKKKAMPKNWQGSRAVPGRARPKKKALQPGDKGFVGRSLQFNAPRIVPDNPDRDEDPGRRLDLDEDENWIQDAEKDIERRGTEGVCTGEKFGSESCPPGSKRYNLAKTFRKMAKKRKKKD